MSKISKKKIKRNPKSKGTEKYYFDSSTDDAINLWQKTDSPEERAVIYEQKISPAFDALVTNLMQVYTFKCPRETNEVIKSDCISFLYEKLNKWDLTRGTRAFSYYNITAKRWLINKSKKSLREDKKNFWLDDQDFLSDFDVTTIESHSIIEDPTEITSDEDMKIIMSRLLEELDMVAQTANEIKAANAIKHLFDNIDSLDIVNKRSVLIYMRELTGINSDDLSTAMHTLRKRYRELTGNNGIFSYEFWED